MPPPPAPAYHAVDVATVSLQAGLAERGRPQRALERGTAGAHPHGDLASAGQRQLDRLGTGGQPPSQSLGKFLRQRLHDLIPEGVGVVELHDSAPWPAAVSRRPGITLHCDHLVTAARQRGAHEQAGGAQSDDGYSHDDHPFGILVML